jgi:ABC-2 type transport system permease protein
VRSPTSNPVLGRELKERLRTRRATVVVVGYLGILAVVLRIVYAAQTRNGSQGFVDPGMLVTEAASIGRTLFETLVFFMLVLVVLLVPGMTADALTGERERQTLVPLQVTLLRPRSIVGGKLMASLAFVTFLVLVTLPLLGVSFLLGGVTWGHLVAGVAAVLATGVFLACLSIACSAYASRTQAAMVLAYAMTFLLVIGSGLVYAAQEVFDDDPGRPPLTALLFNPFFATADAIAPVGEGGRLTSPLEPMRTVIAREVEWQDEAVVVGGGGFARAIGAEGFGRRSEASGWSGIPFWVRSAAVLGWVAIALFVLSARRLRTPATKGAT